MTDEFPALSTPGRADLPEVIGGFPRTSSARTWRRRGSVLRFGSIGGVLTADIWTEVARIRKSHEPTQIAKDLSCAHAMRDQP